MYSLTLEAATAGELAHKVDALYHQFHRAADPVMPEVRSNAPVDQTSQRKAEPDKQPAQTTQRKAEDPKAAPEPSAETTAIVVPDKTTDAYGFNKFLAEHIIPRVTKLVQAKGKGGIEAVLEPFGVAKASHVETGEMLNLIAALDAALAEG